MSGTKVAPYRAIRKMFVASIEGIGKGIVGLELRATWCSDVYFIALSVSHPAIAAFADEEGLLDSFFELQACHANFHFVEAITDEEIECVPITKIKKVKGKA